MRYGKKPEGMGGEDWTVECQARYIARAMKQGRNSVERGGIFEEQHKRFPAVTKERVAEIWREGVPMPDKPDAPDGQTNTGQK